MGRRRWRFVTITAFLLFVIKDTQCQDANYYLSPVEKSFAQVQPPLFPKTRQYSFYEHEDNYRVAPTVQQPLYHEGQTRFPSPNYNQNPTPFQLPTGRSQAGTPYYVNQPEFTAQRSRFRPALPYNFQFVHPASTKRPDVPQIHSVAYQNDPSKPETFLGQITLNNPDIDYLQNNRFKNMPFDGNSLKSNGQSGHIPHEEDVENDQDLLDHHRVTTYNPHKLAIKQRLNVKPNTPRFTQLDSPAINENTNSQNTPNNAFNNNNNFDAPKKNANLYQSPSTEYKGLLDIEPLLEDDIRDISSFRELMKNTQGSFDVEVIKSNRTEAESTDDSKPDASSMNADNYPREGSVKSTTTTSSTSSTTTESSINSNEEHESGGTEDEGEYVEYYDDVESSEDDHIEQKQNPREPYIAKHATEPLTTDAYTYDDDYDTTEESINPTELAMTNNTESFDVLVMKPNNTMVEDDNFKHFVDTTVIDQNEQKNNEEKETSDTNYSTPASDENVSSIEIPSIVRQEVSVVTTKSVVNGTISIPDVTFAPSTTKLSTGAESTSPSSNQMSDASVPVTTENWIVVASVQTSRSVSGARFLPFPTVEQDEKKQVLADDSEGEDEDDEEPVTKDPRLETNGLISTPSSTENINDKLDSIQSELSSAVLSGSLNNENKNIELITESTTESTTTTTTTSTTTTTTTPSPIKVFTLKSTSSPSATERSSPDPLPVQIKKFAHRVTSSTTPKPRKKPALVTVMDDIAGLLPSGYKSRLSFKNKRTTTTSTTTTTTTSAPETFSEVPIINGTQGRSSGISAKNKVIVLDFKSLLPKEYKPKENKPQEDIIKKLQKDDLSKLLPSNYKPPSFESQEDKSTSKSGILDKIEKVDISDLLPKVLKINTSSVSEKPKVELKLPVNAMPIDVSALLPPGFKLNATESETAETPIIKLKVADISSLLPPGFKLNETVEAEAPTSTTTKAPGMIKLVFPSRPGGKVQRKTTTSKPLGPVPEAPKIQKGWPIRASTEFTGWPSPSTTPFSIEKLLEAQRNATATSPLPEFSTEATTRRISTTTTTTPVPPPPTTPGLCKKECDIAATIKIVSGVKWIPELLDHNTVEWKRLATDVKEELNSVYSKSDYLRKWYKGIRIDGFSEGSVLVDYFIELKEVEERVDTLDLKKMFHKSLNDASPGSVVEIVTEETFTEDQEDDEFDPDVMLGDQPDGVRMKKSNEKMTKTIDKSAGKLEIGKFVMDPAYTEFIVLPKREAPTPVVPEEESFLPQWGIAVIVIALASLLFVVIFGVTVLVNRQKSAKAKQPIPLSEEMLRDLDKSHMGGFDDVHPVKERELPYPPSGKRMSTAFIEQLAYPNPGDSWRSEWTPQLQKYMQHYTPDSGRGSQIYGPVGNAYGYGGGSQLYGQTGGGSQVYGYTGEYPRSHYARRRSDYDSNF